MKLYRGKTKDGKWVYGWYVFLNNKHYIVKDGANARSSHKVVWIDSKATTWVEVIPSTVGQSIPKKDVNNKTIYEMDDVRVKYTDILGKEYEAIGIVEIDDFGVMLDFLQYGTTVPIYEFFTDEPEDFEVVANEIDSPDYALNSHDTPEDNNE